MRTSSRKNFQCRNMIAQINTFKTLLRAFKSIKNSLQDHGLKRRSGFAARIIFLTLATFLKSSIKSNKFDYGSAYD